MELSFGAGVSFHLSYAVREEIRVSQNTVTLEITMLLSKESRVRRELGLGGDVVPLGQLDGISSVVDGHHSRMMMLIIMTMITMMNRAGFSWWEAWAQLNKSWAQLKQ